MNCHQSVCCACHCISHESGRCVRPLSTSIAGLQTWRPVLLIPSRGQGGPDPETHLLKVTATTCISAAQHTFVKGT